MNPARRRLWRTLSVLFGLAGTIFLVIAFRATWDRAQTDVVPPLPTILGAAALAILGLLTASRGWGVLLESDIRAGTLARGFFASQLGKYIPGGVWQAMGQVGLAARAGVPMRRAAIAFPVHVITQAAAGGAAGAGLVFVTSALTGPARFLPLLGLLSLLFLSRRWMVRALHFMRRLLPRGADEETLPSQRAILRSFAWSLVTFLLSGLAFALLARSLGVSSLLAGALAFALAWTAGFLVLPLPSGVGVREAVLIATLATPENAAPVIAASVLHRLLTMAAEVALIATTRLPLFRGLTDREPKA